MLARQAMDEYYLITEDMNDDSVLKEAKVLMPCITQGKENFRPISVEQWHEFCMGYVDDEPIMLLIKMDGLVLYDTKYLLTMEHKTVSGKGFGTRAINAEVSSNQSKCYSYGASEIFKKEVSGVMYNFLVKLKIPELNRHIHFVSERDRNRFKDNTLNLAKEMLERENGSLPFTCNFNECHTRWGDCPFSPLCDQGDSKEVREMLYSIRPEGDKPWEKKKVVLKK